MFEGLPDRSQGSALFSADTILEKHVREAIAYATERGAEARTLYDKLVSESSDEERALGWPRHASMKEQDEADLAVIKAVLLTAMHIEGAINAWGVYVTGEEFFKSHIERCPLESKVALTIALDRRGIIPRNHPTLAAIRNLFDRRNQLAHRKTKEWNSSLDFTERAPESDIELCISALDTFRKLLLDISRKVAFMAGGYGGFFEATDPS